MKTPECFCLQSTPKHALIWNNDYVKFQGAHPRHRRYNVAHCGSESCTCEKQREVHHERIPNCSPGRLSSKWENGLNGRPKNSNETVRNDGWPWRNGKPTSHWYWLAYTDKTHVHMCRQSLTSERKASDTAPALKSAIIKDSDQAVHVPLRIEKHTLKIFRVLHLHPSSTAIHITYCVISSCQNTFNFMFMYMHNHARNPVNINSDCILHLAEATPFDVNRLTSS